MYLYRWKWKNKSILDVVTHYFPSLKIFIKSHTLILFLHFFFLFLFLSYFFSLFLFSFLSFSSIYAKYDHGSPSTHSRQLPWQHISFRCRDWQLSWIAEGKWSQGHCGDDLIWSAYYLSCFFFILYDLLFWFYFILFC